MELSTAQLNTLLLVAGGALVLLLIWIITLSYRLRAQTRRTQALINVVRGEIKAMTTGSIGMGKRLKSIEHRLNLTVEKQQELEHIDHARALARELVAEAIQILKLTMRGELRNPDGQPFRAGLEELVHLVDDDQV